MTPDRVVILNDASVARGGATGLALWSVRLLRARGVPVTYVCGDGGDDGAVAATGADLVAVGGAALLQRGRAAALRQGIYNAQARDVVARHVAECDTPGTVYHVHGWAQILSPALFDALAPVAARVVIHAHDMFLACPNGVYMDYPRGEVCTRVPLSASCLTTNCDKRSYLQKGWRVARQMSLRRTLDLSLPWARILAIHPGMRPRLMRAGYPEGLIGVLRNPVAPWCDRRVAAEDNHGLVYVGRLERDKGILDLCAAARRTGMALTAVGDGALRAHIADAYPEVTVTGWMPRERIGGMVRGARALVQPAHHPEPFALVLPEAIFSGLPVVTSDTALMTPEIVEAGLGLSAAVQDPADFDAALVRMRDMDRGALAEMSRRGYDREVALGLTPEAWADGLLAAYGAALSDPARPASAA
ncbi:glycosyltransferase [Rhodobacteraceae bacterium CCMM004]|nr:glycosyltransferase [Rhodobacteraceae bacterium CCMM004]